MHLLNEKHLILFKAAFDTEPSASKALLKWQGLYQNKDLDWTTRSLLPLLVQRFPKSIPNFERYRTYYQQTWLENFIKFKKFQTILNKLNAANIPVCLLKGSAMLLHYYKNLGMRPGASDIDLFIPKESLFEAIKVLEECGLKANSVYKYNGSQYRQHIINQDKNILRFHHAINYSCLNMDIDLHWKLSPYLRNSDFSNLKPSMQTITLNQQNVYLLSLAHHFIHISFHGMSQITSCQKLWWMMDILYLLSQYKSKIDWQSVYKISKKHHIEKYILHTLYEINRINSSLTPQELLKHYQKKNIPFISILKFKLHHQNIKYIRQFISYYSIFFNNQPSLMRRLNPFIFISFIQNYFGFSSKKAIFKHLYKQRLDKR